MKKFTITEAGLKIRSIGKDYDIVFIVAALDDALKRTHGDIDEVAVAESVAEKCKEAFFRVKDELELVDKKDIVGNPWELKPILDGKDDESGRHGKTWTVVETMDRETVEWQFEFPGMDKAQCEAVVRSSAAPNVIESIELLRT